METRYSLLPRIPVTLQCDKPGADFEGWRHTIGHGGINKYPLPPRVSGGLAALKPKLVRTFIQEYFHIYPEHGRFDWSALDPYMESLAASGGSVVACICIKPKPLYPEINQRIIMPNDIVEWQTVVEALVHRYSIEKKIVTYWEIANESDIGETGGCPYLTLTPEEYNEYYRITQEAVLRAFPQAKVGGPALANPQSPLLEGLLKFCTQENLQLDFVSWHIYNDDPNWHAGNARRIRELLDSYYPNKHIETLVTEMNCGFQDVSVNECAYDSLRCAAMAASVFGCYDAKLDWSFYYHIWDQVFVKDQFREFYEDPDIMLTHWNKIPHRFGLFGVCGEVRPSYFFYKLMNLMKKKEVPVMCPVPDLRVKSTADETGSSTILVNYDTRQGRDMVAELDYSGLKDGLHVITIYRVDNEHRWDPEKLELIPVERRYVDISAADSERAFYTQVYCPANTVSFISVEPVSEEEMLAEYQY